MKNKKGFSLPEVMIVIAVIGILLAIIVPHLVMSIDKTEAQKIGITVEEYRESKEERKRAQKIEEKEKAIINQNTVPLWR